MKTTLNDVKFFNLKTIIESDRSLVPIESQIDVPFSIERVFYVYGVKKQNDRGKHSHHKTKQVLICLNGEIIVKCDDGDKKNTWKLNKLNQALYIPEMIWDEQVYSTPDSVLLVFANTYYDESDYITNYKEFKRLKKIDV